MEVWLPVVGVALLVLVAIGGPLADFLVFLIEIREDLKSNRNERGIYRKPSAKHVI